MEKNVGSHVTRWNILRILSMAFLLLTFGLLMISFQPWPPWIVGPVALAGILFGLAAVVTVDRIWAKTATMIISLMFFISLFWHILSSTVADNLPMLLLLFVLVLFSVENLNALCQHKDQYSKKAIAGFAPSVIVLRKSTEQIHKQIERLGLVLGTCYIVTIGIVYIGVMLSPFAPVLSDISLHIVVVSTSLALLVITREERAPAEDVLKVHSRESMTPSP